MHDSSPRIAEACGVPFFKTSGEPLRTQICRFAKHDSRFAALAARLSLIYLRAGPGSFPPVPASATSSRIFPAALPPGRSQKAEYIPLRRSSPLPASAAIRVPCSYSTSEAMTELAQPARARKTGSSPWPTTAPTSAAGRSSPANPPSRASCRPPSAASPANRRCPRAQAAPTPASTPWPRWPAFALQAPIPAENLLRALNRTLPAVDPDTGSENGAKHLSCPPLGRGQNLRVPHLPRPHLPALPGPLRPRLHLALDLKLERAAADSCRASTTSSALPPPIPTLPAATIPRPESQSTQTEVQQPQPTIRTIFSSAWERAATEAGELLVYRVRGNGFLHHMVRNLVGTMLEIGRGQSHARRHPRNPRRPQPLRRRSHRPGPWPFPPFGRVRRGD